MAGKARPLGTDGRQNVDKYDRVLFIAALISQGSAVIIYRHG